MIQPCAARVFARTIAQPRSGSRVPAAPEFRARLPGRSAARGRRAIFCTLLAALVPVPGIAIAHAIIVAAQPAMNATVAPGEIAIRLEFNSRLDRQRSGLSLQGPDGTVAAVALAAEAPPGCSPVARG